MAFDFHIKDFFYPIDIIRLKGTLDRTQWMSSDDLRDFQEYRLGIILRQAFSHVPYYKRLFETLNLKPEDIRGLNDLRKLPLLYKHTVRNADTALVAENASRYRPIPYKTSGTTGKPVEFYLDKHARILEFVYYWRHWGWAGYRLGNRFAQIETTHFLRQNSASFSTWSWQPLYQRLLLNSGQISISHAKETADAIRKHRPLYLNGMASSLYFLALNFREANISDLSFKAIFSNGEILTAKYRKLIEDVFHCPILDSYSHMEGTVAISQCMKGQYHINSDYGILEHQKNEPVSTDSFLGRVIGTSLYNHAMPLIRYDVGDSVEFFNTPRDCPCGLKLPLIKAIHGRKEDVVTTPDGKVITSLFVIPELVPDIQFIQFIQESPKDLLINVIPDSGWNSKNRDQLFFYLRRLLGKEMKLHLNQIKSDQIKRDASGKIRIVLSHLSNQAPL